jgi:hypothetical protein
MRGDVVRARVDPTRIRRAGRRECDANAARATKPLLEQEVFFFR